MIAMLNEVKWSGQGTVSCFRFSSFFQVMRNVHLSSSEAFISRDLDHLAQGNVHVTNSN